MYNFDEPTCFGGQRIHEEEGTVDSSPCIRQPVDAGLRAE
jgi:hypothetical protein